MAERAAAHGRGAPAVDAGRKCSVPRSHRSVSRERKATVLHRRRPLHSRRQPGVRPGDLRVSPEPGIVPVTPADRFPLWLRGMLWGLVIVACVLLAYEIPNRGIDPDELEHLHAAYCVWRGEVPYRDFFEHHGPALYYCLWPILKLYGPLLSVLW